MLTFFVFFLFIVIYYLGIKTLNKFIQIEMFRFWEYEQRFLIVKTFLEHIKAYFGFKTTMTNAHKRIQAQKSICSRSL